MGPTPAVLPYLAVEIRHSFIFSVWIYEFLFFQCFIISHYCLLIISVLQLSQIFPMRFPFKLAPVSLCHACILKKKKIFLGTILYFLAKQSYLVRNQPILLGAWFLLLECDITGEKPVSSCAQCFWAHPLGHIFFRFILSWRERWANLFFWSFFQPLISFYEANRIGIFQRLRKGTLKIFCMPSECMFDDPEVSGTTCF